MHKPKPKNCQIRVSPETRDKLDAARGRRKLGEFVADAVDAWIDASKKGNGKWKAR